MSAAAASSVGWLGRADGSRRRQLLRRRPGAGAMLAPAPAAAPARPGRITVEAAAGGAAKLYTLLGKGGSGRSSLAIALARHLAAQGQRTLLAVFGSDLGPEQLLGADLAAEPAPLAGAANLSGVRLLSTRLLAMPYRAALAVDAKYGAATTPGGGLQGIKAEELALVPGIDSLLVLGALQALGRGYDAVVFDGPGAHEQLRMLGAPERSLWYLQRLREALRKTDAGRVGLPALSPIVEAFLNEQRGGGGALDLGPGGGGPGGDAGSAAVFDEIEAFVRAARDAMLAPQRHCGLLLVPAREGAHAIATTRRLWGASMQAGARVGAALLLGGAEPSAAAAAAAAFAPLPALQLPGPEAGLAALQAALPADVDPQGGAAAPPPVRIDEAAAMVNLFLPGFAKGTVKLSLGTRGSELIVDAGDQRRSVLLPTVLRGGVAGAKLEGDFLNVALKRA